MSFYKEVPGRQTTLESTLKFDTEPKAGSTNPVTSDGVNAAIDGAENALSGTDHEGSTLEIPDPDNKHTVGKFTFGNGTFYYCSAKSDGVATLYENSICEALNFLKGLIDDRENKQFYTKGV